MHFDIRTASFLTAQSAFFMAVGMLWAAAAYSNELPGMRRWAWACLGYSLAWILFGLHGIFPDSLTVVMAGTVQIWAISTNYYAWKEYLSGKASVYLPYGLAAMAGAAIYYFHFIRPTPLVYATLTSLLPGAMFFSMANLLFNRMRRSGATPSRTYLSVMAGYCLCAVFGVVQFLQYLLFYNGQGYLIDPTDFPSLQDLQFCLVFVEIVVMSFCFLLLCNEGFTAQLQRLATIDTLTTLYNRAAVEELLQRTIANSRRSGQPLCVVLCDVDHFKRINDTFGHAKGDEALRMIATELKSTVRLGDFLGRYGGEEFMVTAVNTPLSDACVLAERLRATIAQLTLNSSDGPCPITMSFGIAELQETDDLASLVSRADGALYEAKAAGRNRVISALIAPSA